MSRSNMPPSWGHRGLQTAQATLPATLVEPEPRPVMTSPLLQLFPVYDSWNFGAREIIIDGTAATSPAIAAGQTAWWSLGKIKVDEDTGVEVGIVGYDIQMLPADVNGTAVPSSGTVTAWGSNTGTASAIIMGVNLPSLPGQWVGAPAYVPGIDNAFAGNLQLPNPAPRYLCVQGFPTGALSDAAPNKPNIRYMSGANIVRVGRGQTIDVAFLLNRTQYEAIRAVGAARVMVMHVSFLLKTTPWQASYQWGG